MLVEVLYNEGIAPSYFKLGFRCDSPFPVDPGQFLMLRVSKGLDPFLCRPFGIYRMVTEKSGEGVAGGLEILYMVVGRGTALMSELRKGEIIDVFGPLGQGFPPFDGKGRLLMVAGGVGIVPFYLIAERLAAGEGKGKLLFGGRCRDDLPGLGDFMALGLDVAVTTDDGTMGEKGVVTDLLENELSDDVTVYACGPKGMLREVARIAGEHELPCFVSLDRRMACGMGACLGCAVKVRDGAPAAGKEVCGAAGKKRVHTAPPYRMVCKDGPVFDAGELEWEEI